MVAWIKTENGRQMSSRRREILRKAGAHKRQTWWERADRESGQRVASLEPLGCVAKGSHESGIGSPHEFASPRGVAFYPVEDSLTTEQAALTAGKQETSKRLKAALRRGQAIADFLRTGVRQVYGYGSEKLIEFGMQPIRPRSNVSGSEPTPIPAEATSTDEPAE